MSAPTEAFAQLSEIMARSVILDACTPAINEAMHRLHVAITQSTLSRPTHPKVGHVVCYGAGLLRTVEKVHCEHLFSEEHSGEVLRSDEYELLGFVPVWSPISDAKNPVRAKSLAVR